MRQKRAKTYRKLMHLYCRSFGFRQPYQVLVDSETCKAAISHKIDIVKQLGTVLQGEVKPMITQCCIHELYLQGKSQQSATDLAKTFERRKCNHKEPIPGDECLLSVVGESNKHRYVIFTQSHPLRIKLRSIPAAPIIHINRSVVVLEPPSDVTLQTKSRAEEQSLHATDKSSAPISIPEPPKNKKGPKGPNPLSVKKKAIANPSTHITRQTNEMPATRGMKRKREVADDERDSDDEIMANKKRKRKRKHKSSQHA
ncbi:hypothetical protein Agabi119p4_630 [Agaricus bisporus var. burnettii]|uniref:U three protein 23 n=1 Tax=Agaricus bisporus var. burnettii TaxID=192524 RepID=A0A8H7KKZ0_AGABI|nr:hypothetical protein Agabi119p4_630 [Agaricus bisporus var. burnettii]